MRSSRIAVIGAGIAGLVAALELAAAGFEVCLFERSASPGGKMREIEVGGRRMDAGPTVFTLREVFDEIFAHAGDSLDAHLKLVPARVLARHAWSAGERLDLYADLRQSADAIGRFAGRSEAEGFVRFAAQARRIFTTLEQTFIRAARPTPFDLVRRAGFGGLGELLNINPFTTLSQDLKHFFADARLRQLFGRYATYCGSSPFQSPATLMLIAHVEQAGVWYVEGGMHRLAAALAAVAARHGAALNYSTEIARIHVEGARVSAVETAGGERIAVDAVVCNADNGALAAGLFGPAAARSVRPTARAARSLSAVTWNMLARTEGFELARHTVFFSADYAAEFDDIFRRGRLPSGPTVYVCAQDRCDPGGESLAAERLFCLVNAPPTGDVHPFESAEIEQCESRVFELLRTCGLTVHRTSAPQVTTPADFERLYPATGGALYGPASHGWRASFVRPGSRSSIPGLYLAGGSTHPGAGVPMAATSGRLAAASIVEDHTSIRRSRPVAMPGGTSMR
ncbi:MAG: 1-hydroxycarotenoid 3,4-desaturase CrtD [Steroidobacteraceae bacterium]